MRIKIFPLLLVGSCLYVVVQAVAPVVGKSYLIKSALNRLYLLSLQDGSTDWGKNLHSLTTQGFDKEPLPLMKWKLKTFELSGIRFDQSLPNSQSLSLNILSFEKPLMSSYPGFHEIVIEATRFEDTYFIKSLGRYGTKGKCLKVSDDGGSVSWEKCVLYSNRLWKFEETN